MNNPVTHKCVRMPSLAPVDSGFLPSARQAAFSLVEVVLALGLISFSFMVLFSLVPMGQGMMSKSIEATVGMQIVQRVTTLANQAKFTQLSSLDVYPGLDAKGGEKADYFFDEQGNEVLSTDPALATKAVYSAAVVVLANSALPGRTAADASQSLTTVSQINSTNFATLNIIIRKYNGSEILRTVNTLIAKNGI